MNNLCTNLAAIGLVLYDLILYLDTHPDDPDALNAYGAYKQMYAQAVANYEEKFGPLTANSCDCDNYFKWVKGPWPWEGGMC